MIMNDLVNQAQIGDNLPPEEIDDELAGLESRAAELETAFDRWHEEGEKIEDDDRAGKSALYVKQMTKHIQALETERKARNEPFRAEIKANDSTFNAIKQRLEIIKKRVLDALTAYQRAKDAAAEAERRKATQEEAEAQRRAEEARKAAEAPDVARPVDAQIAAEQAEADAKAATKAAKDAAQPVRSRSEYGQVATLTKRWVHEIEDPAAVNLEALRIWIPATALDQAARAYIKAWKGEEPAKIKGIRFFEESSSRVS